MHHPEPLNFSSKALVSLERFKEVLKVSRHPDAGAVSEVINLLRKSVKFVIPQVKELIDMASLQRAVEGNEVPRLPFPICAFESHYKDLHLSEQFCVAYNKRISLCIEYDELPAGHLKSCIQKFAHEPTDGGIVALSINALPKEETRKVAMGEELWSVFPYAGLLLRRPASQINKENIKGVYFQLGVENEQGSFPLDAGMMLVPFCLQQAEDYLKGVALKSAKTAMDAAAGDLFDEVLTPLVVTAILNCGNAGVKNVEAPAKLNKKRASSGKEPIPGYSYISITAPPSKGKQGTQGGSHASPRSHLRRGHIRRYETGKHIWIQATIVNAGKNAGHNQVYKIR